MPTYHHSDHLSVRLNTNSSGTTVGEQGHNPFGESWYATSTTTKWQFTTYERDAESTLDYAIFRYDNSRLGRFMTPNPPAGSIGNPQSLNRYAYVLNNPINLIDPLGLEGHDCRAIPNGIWCPLVPWPVETEEAAVVPILPGSRGFYPRVPGGGVGGDALAAQTVQRIEQKDLPTGGSKKKTLKQTIQCAARGADRFDIPFLIGAEGNFLAEFLFSNTFSAATDLILGPGRVGGAVGVAGEFADDAARAGTALAARTEMAAGVQTLGIAPNPSVSSILARQTPLGKAAIKTVSRATQVLTRLSTVGFDASVFAFSFVFCE